MVKEIKCYQDSSGKVHQSEYEAHVADFMLWLMKSDALTEASARVLAEQMIASSGELSSMLNATLLVRRSQTALAPVVRIAS